VEYIYITPHCFVVFSPFWVC